MNRFRLWEPCPREEFVRYTGLGEQHIRPALDKAIAAGYLNETENTWQVSEKGRLFLNSLLEIFLEQE